MKKIICALMLCLVSVMSKAVEIKETSITFPEYQGIVTSEIPANDLYLKAKLWIAENYKSANDVIQLDSPETSTIVGKCIYIYDKGKMSEARVHMTLKIEAKENRFRYTVTITDIRAGLKDESGYYLYAKDPNSKYVTKFSNDFRTQIKLMMNKILNIGVNNGAEEDW